MQPGVAHLQALFASLRRIRSLVVRLAQVFAFVHCRSSNRRNVPKYELAGAGDGDLRRCIDAYRIACTQRFAVGLDRAVPDEEKPFAAIVEAVLQLFAVELRNARSEERRVGKE